MLTDKVIVATITHQRSGSKWFGSILRSGLSIGSLGEIFNPDDTSLLSFRAYVQNVGFDKVVRKSQYEVLDDYFNSIGVFFGKIFNFDIMFNQMDWITLGWNGNTKFIYEYLRSRNAVVIGLVRDPVDIFCSMKALDISKRPHVSELDSDQRGSIGIACQQLDGQKVSLSVDEFYKFRENLNENWRSVRKYFDGHHGFVEICYEDLVNNVDLTSVIEKITACGRYLKLFEDGIINAFPRLLKVSDDYERVFDNIDDLRAISY
ncbi:MULTISPECIES: hypothetical protein [Sphingobium]|uniref:hypothetical protein n=1 Tax=Sphingobium TaxID=165695 RepID=UPI00159CA146|nr:hypothetical protein [Sphingobium sp. 15-1]